MLYKLYTGLYRASSVEPSPSVTNTLNLHYHTTITHPRCYYKADTWYPQHFHTPAMPSAIRLAYLLSHDASEMLYSPPYRKSLQTRQNCCITPYTADTPCPTGLSLYSTTVYSHAIQYTAYTLYSTIHRPSGPPSHCRCHTLRFFASPVFVARGAPKQHPDMRPCH